MEPTPPDTAVEARLDALEATVARQERQIARLLSSRGGYGEADVRLLLAIHEAADGLPFRAKSIMRRAEDVPALKAALDGALIETGQELGKFFTRLQDLDVERVRLEQVKHVRGGWWWRTVRTDPQCVT